MEISKENQEVQNKQTVFQGELDKLTTVFTDVEEGKRKLVEGCIQDAAFLYAENWELRQLINKTGSVRVHPQHPEVQKTIPAVTQYLKNINSYAVIIKTLNSVLSKNLIEPDDELEEFK